MTGKSTYLHPISPKLRNATNYVHYYFRNFAKYSMSNAQYNFDNITSEIRAQSLKAQIGRIDERIKELKAGEAGNAIGLLLDKDTWDKNIGEGYDQDQITKVKMTDGVLASTGINYKNAEEVDVLVQQLLTSTDAFVESFEKAVNEMMGYIHSSETLEDYRAEVLAAYGDGRTLDGKAAQKILSEFINGDGLIAFKNANGETKEKQLKIVIEKCLSVIDAIKIGGLESYIKSGDFEGSSKSEVSYEGQIFKKLASKVSKLISGAQGITGEIGSAALLATAGAEALKKAGIENIRLFTNPTGTGTNSGSRDWGGGNIKCAITAKQDPSMAQEMLNTDTIKKVVNKKDYELLINVKKGHGTVVFTSKFGVSVKNYTINPSSKTIKYTIHEGGAKSFAKAYQAAFPADSSFLFLFNLGAGHTYKNKFHDDTTTQTLDQEWVQLVRTTVVANFVQSLAGSVTEDTLLLSLNRQIYPVSYVLDQVLKYIEGGESGYTDSNSGFGYGYQLNGISRKKMLKTSTWLKSGATGGQMRGDDDPEAALIRSEQAYTSMMTLLSNTKLTISLRMLTSLITG